MTCSSPPPMTHFPIVIPYAGAPGAPFFDGQNITDFLDRYSQLCSDYHLSESEKINRLPSYCEFFTGNYVKILIKGADWAAVRAILRREYKKNDLDQLMYSREFLEALKKKARSEDDNLIMHYCRLFASISRNLVSRKRLDLYTQCQWFLQGLPERIVMEIFYRYDIDLEDDDSLNFEDLLEKTLVLVKRCKCLAAFIRDKETDLHTGFEENAPSPLSTVERFMYPAQDLTPPPFQTVKATIQEVIPVVRIHTSRVKEASELSLSDNACILVSDPNVYENLEALFAEPMDKDLKQPSVSSVGPFKHVDGTRIGTQSLNIKSKRQVRRLASQALKKAGCLGIGRLGQKPMKSEDHG